MERAERRKVTTKKRIESGRSQEASEAILLLQTTCVDSESEEHVEDEQQRNDEQVPSVLVMTDKSMNYISHLEEEIQRHCEEN